MDKIILDTGLANFYSGIVGVAVLSPEAHLGYHSQVLRFHDLGKYKTPPRPALSSCVVNGQDC